MTLKGGEWDAGETETSRETLGFIYTDEEASARRRSLLLPQCNESCEAVNAPHHLAPTCT